MKIGVFSTFMSPLAAPKMIRDFGRRAEDIGLDSIWKGEHVVLFDKNTSAIPARKMDAFPSQRAGACWTWSPPSAS
jgi:alkanesulfonate monooxygenase SsuD/methylene tetrahydromethanopterin reductase-like flavin-dependent oxidoreductase (luciferase family)